MARHPDPRFEPRGSKLKSMAPWPLIAIVVAALLLIVVLYQAPRSPKKAEGPAAGQVPDQPNAGELQMSEVKITPSPADGGAVVVSGRLTNTGQRPVGGVMIDAIFNDAQGNDVFRDTQPASAVTAQRGAGARPVDMQSRPIAPGQAQDFRVQFAGVPETWDRQAPEMRIVHVTLLDGGPGSGALSQGAGGKSPQTPASDVNANSSGKPSPGKLAPSRKKR
ncbi:MAG TPA: DUF3426 domain-containing protein [Terriglobales bacterium]|nr:DUF3426 domain-containing protein [Terriglobales bacterium]